MVLAVLDERRRLRLGRDRDQTKIVRMRDIMRMQADRIWQLQEDISMEQERMNTLREQLQVINDRLIRVVCEIRDRS